MTACRAFKRWIEGTPAAGLRALAFAITAVLVPTMIRLAVDPNVSGVAFSPYIPFVLLAAMSLEWVYAASVALVSAAIADLLFIEPRFEPLAGPTDAFGVVIFLASSALIIAFVQCAKRILETRASATSNGCARTGIIFSLERGQAWASWHGSQEPLRLGPEREVTEMMQDFLAQVDLGKRLTEKNRPS